MRFQPIKKTLYTLNIGDYAPEIRALTFPLLRGWADKIGADFHVIEERKFPDWPIVYEKLQIYELGQGNDWNIFADADTLVHPEMFDVTEHIGKDTVCHNGSDMANIRWKYDGYFRRDGRNIGSCNWFTVASDWCLDLWRPLEDLTFQEALGNIRPTVGETTSGFCSKEHLIDDYTLSRNIARFGLKFQTVSDLCGKFGFRGPYGQPTTPFLYHKYTISNRQKVEEMLLILGTPLGQQTQAGAGWVWPRPQPSPSTGKNGTVNLKISLAEPLPINLPAVLDCRRPAVISRAGRAKWSCDGFTRRQEPWSP